MLIIELVAQAVGLVQRSAAAWRRRCSVFVTWTEWTLVMTLSWRHHYNHCTYYLLLLLFLFTFHFRALACFIREWYILLVSHSFGFNCYCEFLHLFDNSVTHSFGFTYGIRNGGTRCLNPRSQKIADNCRNRSNKAHLVWAHLLTHVTWPRAVSLWRVRRLPCDSQTHCSVHHALRLARQTLLSLIRYQVLIFNYQYFAFRIGLFCYDLFLQCTVVYRSRFP